MLYNGKNRQEVEQSRIYLEKLISDGKLYEIKAKKEGRTIDQNSLFHMWVSVIADEIGELNKDGLKTFLKRTILGLKTIEVNGQELTCDYETHSMNTTEMGKFMDKLKIWAQTELGCYLPYYKDAGYEEMFQQYKNG